MRQLDCPLQGGSERGCAPTLRGCFGLTGSRVEVVTHREGAGGTKAASPLPRARPTPTPLCLAGLLWAFKTPEGEKAGQFSDELKAHSRGKAVPSAAALCVSRVSRRESRRFRQVLSAAQAGPFIPVFLGRSRSLLGVNLKNVYALFTQ